MNCAFSCYYNCTPGYNKLFESLFSVFACHACVGICESGYCCSAVLVCSFDGSQVSVVIITNVKLVSGGSSSLHVLLGQTARYSDAHMASFPSL